MILVILRKPYAFLIKYFQVIHLVLLVLCSVLFYQSITLQNFVRDFISTESYNASLESVHRYVNFTSYVAFFLLFAILFVLMILLRYKKKPWKIYLFIFFAYIFLFIVFLYISSFFDRYDVTSSMTTIMAGRDLLFLATLPQYLVFVVFAIRLLGLDLKQFGFKKDEEYLDVKEEDREEFEVNISFDKESIVRKIKSFFRQVKYVYVEHRFLCNSLIIALVLGISLYCVYYFAYVLKVYREGDAFTANSYQIEVQHSYLTNTDTNGDLITSGDRAYLVVDVSVKNVGSARTLNLDRFHLMNRSEAFSQVTNQYAAFADLGNSYSGRKLEHNDSVRFLLVYPVSTSLDAKHYILYYQDVDKNLSIKKIQLNVDDVLEIKNKEEYSLSNEVIFPTGDNLAILSASIVNSATYSTYRCDDVGCSIRQEVISVPDRQILELTYISDSFEGKTFVDFLQRYAKMKYRNIENKEVTVDITSAVKRDYYGNRAFLTLPNDIASDSSLDLVFVFRDQQYIYHLQ